MNCLAKTINRKWIHGHYRKYMLNTNRGQDKHLKMSKSDAVDVEMNNVGLTPLEKDEEKGTQKELPDKDDPPEMDPWALPEVNVEYTPWSELSTGAKVKKILWDYIGKFVFLLGCLYFFICSLDLLSASFRLIGGRTAGSVFKNNEMLNNPVAGLMIGVLATSILQSSSTTTGIAISLVVAHVLEVQDAIPIVMGANIGTSITNTLVSMGQITNKNDFRRAFAGATVHDMFNWMAVIVLLPLEVATGYLYHLTKAIVASMNFPQDAEKKKSQQFLKTITTAFTNYIIRVDKKVLSEIAKGVEGAADKSIVKHCCKKGLTQVEKWNVTDTGNVSYVDVEKVCVEKCVFMFESVPWNDTTIGAVLFVLTLVLITACFVGLVKTLYSVMRGHILAVVKKFINANFPGKLSFLTGYVAIIIGCGTTMVVQSSSVVTSSLTPLVGVGILSIERMYPLTLGANLGTTFTAIIIALSQSAEDMPIAFQVALCHMFFNISGVILFYPLPFMRIPIKLAKFLGNTTAKYRWFGIVYMIIMFILIPGAVFGLSAISWIALVTVAAPLGLLIVLIISINIMQNKKPSCLPKILRTWDWLPVLMTSLAPYDKIFRKLFMSCKCKSKQNTVESNPEKQ